jgi:hypothetical protein
MKEEVSTLLNAAKEGCAKSWGILWSEHKLSRQQVFSHIKNGHSNWTSEQQYQISVFLLEALKQRGERRFHRKGISRSISVLGYISNHFEKYDAPLYTLAFLLLKKAFDQQHIPAGELYINQWRPGSPESLHQIEKSFLTLYDQLSKDVEPLDNEQVSQLIYLAYILYKTSCHTNEDLINNTLYTLKKLAITNHNSALHHLVKLLPFEEPSERQSYGVHATLIDVHIKKKDYKTAKHLLLKVVKKSLPRREFIWFHLLLAQIYKHEKNIYAMERHLSILAEKYDYPEALRLLIIHSRDKHPVNYNSYMQRYLINNLALDKLDPQDRNRITNPTDGATYYHNFLYRKDMGSLARACQKQYIPALLNLANIYEYRNGSLEAKKYLWAVISQSHITAHNLQAPNITGSQSTTLNMLEDFMSFTYLRNQAFYSTPLSTNKITNNNILLLAAEQFLLPNRHYIRYAELLLTAASSNNEHAKTRVYKITSSRKIPSLGNLLSALGDQFHSIGNESIATECRHYASTITAGKNNTPNSGEQFNTEIFLYNGKLALYKNDIATAAEQFFTASQKSPCPTIHFLSAYYLFELFLLDFVQRKKVGPKISNYLRIQSEQADNHYANLFYHLLINIKQPSTASVHDLSDVLKTLAQKNDIDPVYIFSAVVSTWSFLGCITQALKRSESDTFIIITNLAMLSVQKNTMMLALAALQQSIDADDPNLSLANFLTYYSFTPINNNRHTSDDEALNLQHEFRQFMLVQTHATQALLQDHLSDHYPTLAITQLFDADCQQPTEQTNLTSSDSTLFSSQTKPSGDEPPTELSPR